MEDSNVGQETDGDAVAEIFKNAVVVDSADEITSSGKEEKRNVDGLDADGESDIDFENFEVSRLSVKSVKIL